MFYDVMQQLCLIVIKVKRNRDKLDERLKLIETHGGSLLKRTQKTFSALS